MAAPALALQAAQPTIDATRAEAAKQYAAFNLNPVGYAADKLFKVGLVSTLAGIGAYVLSVGTGRAEQSFLNDLDNTLGIPASTPPTAIAPPTAGPGTGGGPQSTLLPYSPDATTKLDLQSLASAITSLSGGAKTNAQAGSILTGVLTYLSAVETDAQSDTGTPAIILSDLTQFGTDLLADSKAATSATNGGSGNSPFSLSTASARDWNTVYGDYGDPFGNNYIFFSGGAGIGTNHATVGDGSGAGSSNTQTTLDPLTGVENWLGGVAAGATALVGDITVVGRAIANFPRVTADAFGYAVTWGLHTVSTDVYPWLLGVGIGLMIGGTLLRWFGPRAMSRLELGSNARVATLWNRFDKWYKTRRKVQSIWTLKSTDALVHSANAAPEFVPAVVQDASPPPVSATSSEGAPDASSLRGPVAPPEPPSPPEPNSGTAGEGGALPLTETPVPPQVGTTEDTSPTPDQTNALATPPGPSIPEKFESELPPDPSRPDLPSNSLPEESAPDLRAERMRAARATDFEPVKPREWTTEEILAAANSFEPQAGTANYPVAEAVVEGSKGTDLRGVDKNRLVRMMETPAEDHKRKHPGYGKKGRVHRGFQEGADQAMAQDYGTQ